MADFKPTKARHHGGFTLMEVVTVIVLLGILAAGVISTIPTSNVNLVAEADRLKSHLRYVQIRAQADTNEWRLAFTNTSTYQLGQVRVTGQGFIPDLIPGTDGTQGTLTDGATSTEVLIIRFDSWGRPLDDAGTPLSADRTLTLTDGARTETITIRAETGLIP